MAAHHLLLHRYYHRSVKRDSWWIHARSVVCVIFLVRPHYNLHGSIDDTSQLGTQEKKLENINRKTWKIAHCNVREKEVMTEMSFLKEEFKAATPFKNREEVKIEIRECDRFAAITQWACFICAALGVIGDAIDITLSLDSMSWFLLAIVFGLNAIISHNHTMIGKHLLGIENKS